VKKAEAQIQRLQKRLQKWVISLFSYQPQQGSLSKLLKKKDTTHVNP